MPQPTIEIPYGAYWSTPFAKWQGDFSTLHSLRFAAWVAKNELAKRDIDNTKLQHGVLGTSVPQQNSFYGMPWVAGLMGANHITGPSIAQACATGTRCLATAFHEISANMCHTSIVLAADKTSNSPQIYYPNQSGPGGSGVTENWVLHSFAADPLTGQSMLVTAENVAKKHQISKQQQDELTLGRYQQYQMAIADNNAFQRRYMTLPFEVPSHNFKKINQVITGDQGIADTNAESLAKLEPVVADGTVTYAGQTHPADGNAGIIVTDKKHAEEFSQDAKIRIQILAFGQARAELTFMPEAPIFAAQNALKLAGIDFSQLAAIKTHNPFTVNDLVFAKETGVNAFDMNNYGCSLVFGHPQGVTSLRSVIELIEELVIKGGGYGLFTGCSAGDSSMALVLKVSDGQVDK